MSPFISNHTVTVTHLMHRRVVTKREENSEDLPPHGAWTVPGPFMAQWTFQVGRTKSLLLFLSSRPAACSRPVRFVLQLLSQSCFVCVILSTKYEPPTIGNEGRRRGEKAKRHESFCIRECDMVEGHAHLRRRQQSTPTVGARNASILSFPF